MKRNRGSSSSSFGCMRAHTVRSINFTPHIRIHTLQMLKIEWKADNFVGDGDFRIAALEESVYYPVNHLHERMENNQHPDNTEYIEYKMCQCCRLACVLAVNAARLAVMVVPIFSPNTRAAPNSRLIQPLAHMISVIAIVAAEACTIMVSIVPMNKNRRMEKNPISV